MAGTKLLPTRTSVEIESETRNLSLTDAESVFEALASDTARRILSTVHESPAPPSEIAAAVNTSIQNVSYHLDRLETAGLVEPVDTWYSEKGMEMDIYAPTHTELVIGIRGSGHDSG
jgi:DNA-binding transcriptional ArsR family regulator